MKQMRILALLLPILVSCGTNNDYYPSSQTKPLAGTRLKTESYIDIFAAENMPSSNSRAVFDTLPGDVVVQRYGEQYLYQGDMVFADTTLYRLMPEGRSCVNDEPRYHWPYQTVYYTFANNIPDTTKIKAAMNQISSVSSVVFRHKTALTGNYIKFKKASMNNSFVGMQGGCQILNLFNYNHKGIVMHEIMHALGLKHEICRTDRDEYVDINWPNIKPGMTHNFDIYSSDRTANIGSFDYNSIMMYSSLTDDDAFVFNIYEPMFRKKDGSLVYAQRSYLSSGDIEGLKSIYGPPFHRVERRLVVTEEDYYGLYEILEMNGYDYVILYADKNCTTRATSQYPRQLWVEMTVETYSYGSYQGVSSQLFEVTIPAGVDSVYLGSYHNIENYASGNPYNVSITEYNIVNAHVPSYTHPII